MLRLPVEEHHHHHHHHHRTWGGSSPQDVVGEPTRGPGAGAPVAGASGALTGPAPPRRRGPARDAMAGGGLAARPGPWRPTLAWVQAQAAKHFLILALLTALTLGLAWPWLGQQVAAPTMSVAGNDYRVVPSLLVLVIFLSSGLTLGTDAIKKAVRQYLGAAYGLVAILFLTPLAGFAALHIPFTPPEFSYGLALFTIMPTTLTSCITLVTACEGNSALALLLTVSTNLLGIVTVPFMLQFIFGSSTEVSIDAQNLLIKLLLTILLPLAVGKLVRDLAKPVETFMKANKKRMSMLNNACLAAVVWQTISRSADDIIAQSAASILIIIAAGVVLHLAYLLFNFGGVTLLRLPLAEKKAVLICTSEKTLPIAITVLSFLPPEQVGDHGLVAIPCILSHLAQVLMDSVLASNWVPKEEAPGSPPAISLTSNGSRLSAADLAAGGDSPQSALRPTPNPLATETAPDVDEDEVPRV